MAYSDIQNRAFTQIAYMDLADRYGYYSINGKNDAKVPLSDLLYDSEKQTLIDMGISEEEFSKWNLVAVHDTNKDNGFYACVIETSTEENGKGIASVAFRGSEEFGTKHWLPDWVNADFRLINTTQTKQQAEVENFMKENRDLLEKYTITPTGHSLGANLAEYFTIVSDQYGLYDNVDLCVGLDGPGYSRKFLKEHKDQIAKIAEEGKIIHYRWSFVGGLLFDLPGVAYKYVNVSNEATKLAKNDDEDYNCFTRHSTMYTVMKGDSFDKTGSPDLLAIYFRKEAKYLEKLFSILDATGIPVFNTTAAITVIGIVGQLIFEIVELSDGTTIKRWEEKRTAVAAATEAGDNPEFYIDTAEFDRMAVECGSINKKLEGIAQHLRTLRARPEISIPKIFDTTALGIINGINELYTGIDDVVNVASFSAKMAEESISTLEAVKTYFENTSTDFLNTEKAAVSLMDALKQKQEGENE